MSSMNSVPSIHPFSITTSPALGDVGVAGVYPSCLGTGSILDRLPIYQWATQNQTPLFTFISMDNLHMPIRITCVFGMWQEAGAPESTFNSIPTSNNIDHLLFYSTFGYIICQITTDKFRGKCQTENHTNKSTCQSPTG